jgi:2'-5' RNA ligase
MRLFIGAFPPEEVLAQIRDVVRQMDKIKRNFKFIDYEQLHVTLKFLGADVSEESFNEIYEKLNNNLVLRKQKKATIKLSKLMFGFPGQNTPSAMFFDIEPDAALDFLINNINKEVKNVGLDDTIRKKERRKLTHHITIARAKHSTSRSLTRSTREVISRIRIPKIEYEVNEIHFVQSILTIKGPIYKKLSKIEL